MWLRCSADKISFIQIFMYKTNTKYTHFYFIVFAAPWLCQSGVSTTEMANREFLLAKFFRWRTSLGVVLKLRSYNLTASFVPDLSERLQNLLLPWESFKFVPRANFPSSQKERSLSIVCEWPLEHKFKNLNSKNPRKSTTRLHASRIYSRSCTPNTHASPKKHSQHLKWRGDKFVEFKVFVSKCN